MGFYTQNILQVTGKIDELEKFHSSFTTNESFISSSITFDKLYPVPKKLLGDEESLNEWCEENWGIYYYDELDCDKITIDKGESTIFREKPEYFKLEYHFTTKWQPPFSWIDYVSEELFPNLVFELEYDDIVTSSRGTDVCVRCTEYWEQ